MKNKSYLGEGQDSKQEKIPKYMWVIICCVLALAVLIGLFTILLKIGWLDKHFDLNAIPSKMSEEEWANYGKDDQDDQEQEKDPDPEEDEQEDEKTCKALSLSKDKITIEVEEDFFLTAVSEPIDCEEEIVFTSSDEEVVTVNDNGMITAVGPGEAKVTVSCGKISEVCLVTVPEPEETQEDEQTDPSEEEQEPEQEETDPAEEEKEPEAAPVPEVTPSDFTLFYPGEEAWLSVKNVPEGTAVSYVSSNAAVATVTADGKVTAVGNGQATITITVGDVTLKSICRCNLESTTEGGGGQTTEQAPAYTGPFTLNYTDVTFQFKGEKLTLTLKDSQGKTVTGLNWVSSNGAVCSVSNGTITAVGSGNATVSVTYNGTTYSCIIRTGF